VGRTPHSVAPYCLEKQGDMDLLLKALLAFRAR
jgi:hypothetical protein